MIIFSVASFSHPRSLARSLTFFFFYFHPPSSKDISRLFEDEREKQSECVRVKERGGEKKTSARGDSRGFVARLFL